MRDMEDAPVWVIERIEEALAEGLDFMYDERRDYEMAMDFYRLGEASEAPAQDQNCTGYDFGCQCGNCTPF